MAEGSRRATTGPMPARMTTPEDPTQDYDRMEDVRTLAKAEAIKGDKKRHGAAKAHAKKLVAHYGRVMDATKGGKDAQSDESGSAAA